MNIFYNSVDITNSVNARALQITDNAGGQPDVITAVFSDTEGLWSKWNPQKNDTLQVKEKGFDSGVMFIDQLGQVPGSFEIQALSIPQPSKTARSQGWENVRLFDIGSEIAGRHGFSFNAYNLINHLYNRVDQSEEADFTFFACRCMLEGYAVKIHNRSLVVYDEHREEQKAVDHLLGIISENDMNGMYRFDDKMTDIYQKCIIRSQTLTGYIEGVFEATGIYGPTIKRNEFATNQAEADRWAKGLLRSFNKRMITGSVPLTLNTDYAAGSVVSIQDTGMFDGKYFVHRVVHDLIRNVTKLSLRKPLEGY